MANKQDFTLTTKSKAEIILSSLGKLIMHSCVLFTACVFLLYSLSFWAGADAYLSFSAIVILLLLSLIVTASMRLSSVKALPRAVSFILQFVIFIVSFHILFFGALSADASGARIIVADTLVSLIYLALRGAAAVIVSLKKSK